MSTMAVMFESVPGRVVSADPRAWAVSIRLRDDAILRRQRAAIRDHGACVLDVPVAGRRYAWTLPSLDAQRAVVAHAQTVLDRWVVRWARRHGYVASSSRVRYNRDYVTDQPQLCVTTWMLRVPDTAVYTRERLDAALARGARRIEWRVLD